MAASEFQGSCICGSVEYRITGEPFAFNHCHCHRCRKASGTGHASNILLKPASADWTAGKEFLATYKVPGAKRFATVFCSKCGSPLPRVAADLSIAVIPAGSLDSEPPLSPTGRIFWGSRAPWSCADAHIPTWDEYPQKA
jgi:hypothetical protein